MAIGGGGASSGISLDIGWAEPLAELLIQRDTDNGFPAPVDIRLRTVTTHYFDSLPLNGTTYFYRARHERTGFAVSNWTATTSAVPHEGDIQ